MVRVLFVCLGNICRSPTAEAVFSDLVAKAGLQGVIEIDSAGTGGWHVGSPPDERAQLAAAQRGYDMSRIRARQFQPSDLTEFDYVLAMDNANLQVLRDTLDDMAPSARASGLAGRTAHISLFLDFSPAPEQQEVPDPYYGAGQGFEQVLDLVEQASKGLLQHIRSDQLESPDE